MKKYNSFLGAFFSGDSGDGGYNAAYKKSALAKLYSSQDPAEQQMASEGLARVDPEAAQKWQMDSEERVKKHAQLLTSLGPQNPLAVQAWQSRIKPELVRMYGDQAASLPDIPDESIMQYAQQLAGGGQQLPSDVQSFNYFTKGMTPEQVAQARRYKLGLDAKAVPYDIKYDETGRAWKADRNAGTVAEATVAPMGGMPKVPQGADPMAGGLERINETIRVLKANNVPAEQINAWSESEFAKLQQGVQGGVFQQPQQARVAVKPDAPKVKEAPSGYEFKPDGSLAPIKGGPADPALKAAADSQSLDARKAGEQRAALRQDAINFAAAWLGKSPEEVAKMSPQEIREAVAKGGRLTTGPIMGNIWGMNRIANPDLEAYKSSAAAKQARINNPSGPVTEGDFRAAEKAIFSPDKPAQVNADLIYQALTIGAQPAQSKPSNSPVQIRNADDYNRLPSGAQYIDPNGKLRVKK